MYTYSCIYKRLCRISEDTSFRNASIHNSTLSLKIEIITNVLQKLDGKIDNLDGILTDNYLNPIRNDINTIKHILYGTLLV